MTLTKFKHEVKVTILHIWNVLNSDTVINILHFANHFPEKYPVSATLLTIDNKRGVGNEKNANRRSSGRDGFTLFECLGADRAGRLSTTANTNDESP